MRKSQLGGIYSFPPACFAYTYGQESVPWRWMPWAFPSPDCKWGQIWARPRVLARCSAWAAACALLQQTEVLPTLPWSRLPSSHAAFETLGHCASFGSPAWGTTWSLAAKEQKHWAQQWLGGLAKGRCLREMPASGSVPLPLCLAALAGLQLVARPRFLRAVRRWRSSLGVDAALQTSVRGAGSSVWSHPHRGAGCRVLREWWCGAREQRGTWLGARCVISEDGLHPALSGAAAGSPAACPCSKHKLPFPSAFGGYLPAKHRAPEDVLSEMEERVHRGASLLPPHGRGHCSRRWMEEGAEREALRLFGDFSRPPPWLPSRAWSPSDVSGLPAGLDVLPAFLRL